MASFAEMVTNAQTRWDAAVALLGAWRERPPETRPRRDEDDFFETVDTVREHFDAQPAQLNLADADRSLILSSTDSGTDLHKVDAVGFGLNFSASAGFAQCWRERLGTDTYRPAPGDVFPAADAPWPRELDGDRRTPSPRSMGIDPDDHPYARVYRGGTLPVEFDFRVWRPLRQLALSLDLVAAVTVNETLAELGLDEPQPVAFPVTPADPDRQAAAVADQLERAIAAGAQIIVFPELSTSAAIAQQVERRLGEDPAQRLVICGSWHEVDADTNEPVNTSIGVVSGLPHRMYHRKLVEFEDLYPKDPDNRCREGITRPDPPTLRIYVTDQFRFALVICKDFLDRQLAATLDHVGANVLLVPALSRTTQPFKARAGAHIADAQALSLLANGPRTWHGQTVMPTAFLTRPYEPTDTVEATADEGSAVSLFSLRTATVRAV